MENTKAGNNEETKAATTAASDESPNNKNSNSSSSTNTAVVVVVEDDEQEGGESNNVVAVNNPSSNQRTRTPFINLSQVDADLALARTLQEQERAYMILRMNAGGSDYGSWEAGSYMLEDDDDFDDPSEDEYDDADVDDDNDNDEDAFDVHAHTEDGEDNNPGVELDPSAFPSDESYARALQDAEDREMAVRMLALAGINEMIAGEAEDTEEDGGNSQESWEEIDPDELSYEELLALGEVAGTESRGLSANTISSLPSMIYKSESTQEGISDLCVICRLDYDDGENLTVLCCKHSYHSECINNWLRINKVCPVCNAEVSSSGNS